MTKHAQQEANHAYLHITHPRNDIGFAVKTAIPMMAELDKSVYHPRNEFGQQSVKLLLNELKALSRVKISSSEFLVPSYYQGTLVWYTTNKP